MEEEVIIDGQAFSLISEQRSGNTAVYSSGDRFLRLGEKERIRSDLKLHREMEANGFPVASVLAEGEYQDLAYFIEASLGENHFGKLFAAECAKNKKVGDDTFASFLKVVETFASAQLKTAQNERDIEKFKQGIHLEGLCAELPAEAPLIRARFAEASSRLTNFPYVLTHGDFNAWNIYPNGVIDLEDSFYGPAGLDLIRNIIQPDYFPDTPGYEFLRGYDFNEEQKHRYLEIFDELYVAHKLPKLSSYQQDFKFCCTVWLASNMGQWPKTQQFRYELFRRKFLKA